MVRYRIETLPEGNARARDEDMTSIQVEIMGERLDGPRVGIAAS